MVLDDLRDITFLNDHQDVLQSTDIPAEFGSSMTGQWAKLKDLYAVPFIVTTNYTSPHTHRKPKSKRKDRTRGQVRQLEHAHGK